METNLSELVHRYQILKTYQDSSDQLIEDILLYAQNIENSLRDENSRLSEQLRDAELDLADAKKGRRDLQQLVQQYDSRMLCLANENGSLKVENGGLKNRNPYILILIDGDGLLFHEDLIRDRNEGGKRAAAALHAAVATIVGDRVDELEIVARVVANVGGLSKAMVRDGCISNAADFKDFTLGFTQAKASFDFIDVGYGKERADSKIKETTRWHLQNHNCKQVLLGVSHDAGYAPFLDEVLTDGSAVRQRISVLEGYPTVRELRDTRVHIERFSREIFRTTKLVEKSPTISLPNPGPTSSAHGQLTPATSNASMSPPLSSAATVTGVANGESAPTTAPTAPTPAPAVNSSYANITAAPSPPPQMVIPLAPKLPAKKPVAAAVVTASAVAWVPEPRGLDETISVVSQTAMETIKRRKEHNKLCNNHYLRGPCTKIDSCLFVHSYKPSKDELRALAMLSRLNPCTRGQDCEVEDCIYGHHCPSFRDGVCGHPYCRFPVDAHPPGCKFKNTKIHDN